MSEITCFFSHKNGAQFANFNIPYFLEGKKEIGVFAVNKNVDGDYPFHRDWKKDIENKGGHIPEEVFNALERIYAISQENSVNFLNFFASSLEAAKNS